MAKKTRKVKTVAKKSSTKLKAPKRAKRVRKGKDVETVFAKLAHDGIGEAAATLPGKPAGPKIKRTVKGKKGAKKVKIPADKAPATKGKDRLIDQYEYTAGNIPITIKIFARPGEYAPVYECSVSAISPTTEIILERIRRELIKEVSLEISEITDPHRMTDIEDHFKMAIGTLIQKYFPNTDEVTLSYLTTYLIQKALGMGNIENLMMDHSLEEITINGAHEPVWVYHRKHGWLKTNIRLANDDQIRHYASLIARKVGRQISVSDPLLDAHLSTGDRLNATLHPITIRGNTITIRKFAAKPWTITDLIRNGTISPEGAAMIWQAIQYEMSMLVAGGTASGKTSMLNALANFFPPNQRILSIEDTHELQLPGHLHWVPMITRLPNPEGKGEISMLNLLVNSLRMRPDRILVGEIRRKKEAEVLFEAIHTGHSVYATIHANNTRETIIRLTSPPIEVPKSMIPALSYIIVQYRNRRTGKRRTFQIAEVTEDAEGTVLMQYDVNKDHLLTINMSIAFMNQLTQATGLTETAIQKDIDEKSRILKWMVDKNISDVDSVGLVMAEYYTNHSHIMMSVKANKVPSSVLRKREELAQLAKAKEEAAAEAMAAAKVKTEKNETE